MWKHKNFINLQLCAGETWVLNSVINSLPTSSTAINFVSNNKNFDTFTKKSTSPFESYLVYSYQGVATNVYNQSDNMWTNEAYRTVTFLTPPTGDLLTWLQANATKQSPQPTLTFKHFYDAGTIGSGTYKFRHYSQQEPSSGETWVLNSTLVSSTLDVSFTVNFMSNGNSYSKMQWTDIASPTKPYYGFYDETGVYLETGTWTNDAYRTLTFAIPPTGDLLTWLQANGTKQDGGGVIKAGTYLFNEELIAPGDNLSAEFIAKGNSLTADNVYGSQIDIEGLTVLDNGYLTLNGTNDLIEWDLYYWQYQHKVTEEDYTTYTATDTTKLRTIIVENDQTADFYTWFTANTTKLS